MPMQISVEHLLMAWESCVMRHAYEFQDPSSIHPVFWRSQGACPKIEI